MPTKSRHIYTFKYDSHHHELCKLESRHLFNEELKDNLLFSNITVLPSISPFIKNRFQILLNFESYAELINAIKNQNIQEEGFKAEYLVLAGDETNYTERLKKLRDVGMSIEGEPDYYHPSIIYSICHFNNRWYFGVLTKNDTSWHQHKQKPCSFSNSISMYIAKTLVSVASQGVGSRQLLDACCGVGTVMLEACYSQFNIDGCDISSTACEYTKENLAHYNYSAIVFPLDIQGLDKTYDAAIIDLPYNLYAYSDDGITSHIITSTANLTSRIVIVSLSNIQTIIETAGLQIVDFCTVEKRGTSKFTRNIWVCEK